MTGARLNGSPLPPAEAQDLQVGMGRSFDALEALVVHPRHERRPVPAPAGVPVAVRIEQQVGEGLSEEGSADALLVAEHDDLPGVTSRARREVDHDLVSAAGAADDDPSGGTDQVLHSRVR